MTQHRIEALFRRLEAKYPQATTELVYETPFQLLVAVILSAQATDKGVNKATKDLFIKVQAAKDLNDMPKEELLHFIKSIGLYQSKARYLKDMARQLVEVHEGRVPETKHELETLAGVGPKTANVILNTLFDHPVIAVDTHVYRVSRRLGLSQASTVQKVEQDLMKVVPTWALKNAHHYLILHGRYVCKARAPECTHCPLSDLCPFIKS